MTRKQLFFILSTGYAAFDFLIKNVCTYIQLLPRVVPFTGGVRKWVHQSTNSSLSMIRPRLICHFPTLSAVHFFLAACSRCVADYWATTNLTEDDRQFWLSTVSFVWHSADQIRPSASTKARVVAQGLLPGRFTKWQMNHWLPQSLSWTELR